MFAREANFKIRSDLPSIGFQGAPYLIACDAIVNAQEGCWSLAARLDAKSVKVEGHCAV